MTMAEHAFTHLAAWPDLTEVAPSCGTGRALATAHREIVHFHSDREVDLHLTLRAVRRFEDHLAAARAVRMAPGSPWVTVRLDTVADVHLLTTLVTLALQSHQARPVAEGAPDGPCTGHRSGVRPSGQFSGG
ncbi:luciferase family protein [Streptomyces sp. NPDC090106]|uniref:luciferase domain-containing protein n=1 Tax=Streptomyces sp. NPDC090106 TaxID=3365946 RepID=UPI00381365C7